MKPNEIRNFIIFIVVIGLSWYLFPSKYDRLMSVALKKQKDHPEIKVFDGEIEPPMPNISVNDKTILGIDSNHNGIRDDVDIWINRTAQNYNERMAMRQFARARQKILYVCKNNIIPMTKEAEDESVGSLSCLREFTEIENIKNLINTLTFNIPSRDCGEFYNKYSTVITLPNVGDGILNCNFQISKIRRNSDEIPHKEKH